MMRSPLPGRVKPVLLGIVVLVGAVGAAPSVAAHPAPTGTSASLQQALAQFLEHRTGRVTIGVTDLVTGRRVLIRPRHPERTASIVKVEILEALLARRHMPLRPPLIGEARRMIEQSSNDDAQRLYEKIGGAGGLRAFGRRVGLRATRPARGTGPGYAWGLTLTTPADQLRILHLLLTPDPILTERDRAFVLRLMRHVENGQRWGIAAGTSEQALVAIKDGWLCLWSSDWQINSIGYVHAPHHDYLIAVMGTANPTMTYGVRTIGQISRIVWHHTGH